MKALLRFALLSLAVFVMRLHAADVITNIMSPIVSYQYFEWPGDDILKLSSSPKVSYYYQPTASGTLSLPGLLVRTYSNGSPIGPVGGLGAADRLIASTPPIASGVIQQADLLGFSTGEGTGHFSLNYPVFGIPNDKATDNYAVQGTGFFYVSVAGPYTFGLNTDDGARLRIDGSDVIVDDVYKAPHDSALATVLLSAGMHQVEWTWFNSSGGANGGGGEAEVFLAPGAVTNFNSNFRALGDPDGGLSLYQNRNPNAGPFVLHGRVIDLGGIPQPDTVISAMVYLAPLAQATTDGSGNYQLSLDAGVYDLWAVKDGFQTSIRVLTFDANTAEQNFQLKPMPPPPVIQQVTRQPDLSATIGLMGSALRVFDGTHFQPIKLDNAPSPDRMTIVLTHGWNSDPTVWAEGMATAMWANGVTANTANIVAWDWHAAAARLPEPPEERTPSQGLALGQALLGTLGASYSKPVHFIGHSLGALVNAAAANYLHGDRTAQQEVSPSPWSAPVHITLLDEAEAASLLLPVVFVFDGIRAVYSGSPASLPQASDLVQWKDAMPQYATWADNYVSDVGLDHHNAVNVRLLTDGGVMSRHAYSYQWYQLTVGNPSGSILGFKQSYEAAQAKVSSFDVQSAVAAFPAGVKYLRPRGSPDPLALTYVSTISENLGAFAEHVKQGVAGVVEFSGDVTLQIQESAQSAGHLVAAGFDQVAAAAEQGQQSIVTFLDAAVLQLLLRTSLIGGRPGDVHTAGVVSSPLAWVPIEFPSNATAMAFDFRPSGDPREDSLVCAIGTNELFSLQAKYVPTNGPSSSRLIDVANWAGTTNQVFFGFLGGTSSNATLLVENIRFYSLLPPRLNVELWGSSVVLSWPNWATGYTLEASDNIASANSWVAITNVPYTLTENFILTNAIVTSSRFYRLRQY